eukprot:15107-Pleurochrysis_carterae.AAC.1
MHFIRSALQSVHRTISANDQLLLSPCPGSSTPPHPFPTSRICVFSDRFGQRAPAAGEHGVGPLLERAGGHAGGRAAAVAAQGRALWRDV